MYMEMILGIFTYFNNAFIQKSRLSLTWKKARNIGSMNDGWYISLPRTVARCNFWDRQCEEIKSKGKDAWWSLDKRIILLKEKWRGGSGGFFFFSAQHTYKEQVSPTQGGAVSSWLSCTSENQVSKAWK